LITSLGIFGYLTSAYQQSAIKYGMMLDTVKLLEDQKKQEQSKISEVKLRIDSLSALRRTQEARLSEINTNALLARNPIQFRQVQDQTMELIDQTDKNIKSENDKSVSYSTTIDSIDKKISDIKLNTAANKDIQTFKFVADELNVSLNTVVKWFILILIFVFDPLAVALILAYNMAISKEYAIYSYVEPKEPIVSKEPEPIITKPIVTETKIEESNEVQQIVEKYDTNNDGKLDENESSKITLEDQKKMENQGDDFFKRYFTAR